MGWTATNIGKFVCAIPVKPPVSPTEKLPRLGLNPSGENPDHMKLPDNLTPYIAVWGAFLGTLTFCWNILRWRQERPRVLATVEAVKSMGKNDCFSGIRLTLRNRGGKKTTIEHIILYRRERWFESGLGGFLARIIGDVASQFNVGAANRNTIELPKMLDVNELWQRFIPLEASEDDSEEVLRQIDHNRGIVADLHAGVLRYSIQCSHTGRKLRGLVRPEMFSMKE